MLTLEKVPEEARLSYLIGEIVSWDVWAENEMRTVCGSFDRAGLTSEPWEVEYGRMIPQLLNAIDASGIPEPFRKLAASVINAAQRAHKRRSRYAHDILIQGRTKPERVLSMIKRDPPRPLSEFESTADQLRRLTWRLRALHVIAQSWIGPALDPRTDWQDADNLRSWTRVAMDHIADLPFEIRGTPGRCPEPPGGYQSFGD
jgi:hypothetical protein